MKCRFVALVILIGLLLPGSAGASVFKALRPYPFLKTANLVVDLAALVPQLPAQLYPLNAAAQAAWLFPSGEARAQALLAVAGELDGRSKFQGTMGWLADLAAKELGQPKNERGWSLLARALSLRALAGFTEEVLALSLDEAIRDRVQGACAERLARDGRLDSARKLVTGLKERSLPLDRARTSVAVALAKAGLRREALGEARLVENGLWKHKAFRMLMEELARQGFCRELPELALEASGSLTRGGQEAQDRVVYRLLSELTVQCFEAKGQAEALWLANRIIDPLLRFKALVAIVREHPGEAGWVQAELDSLLVTVTQPEARLEALLALGNLLMNRALELETKAQAALPAAVMLPPSSPPPPPTGNPGTPPPRPRGALAAAPQPPQIPASEAALIADLRGKGRGYLEEAWTLTSKVEATVVTSPRFAAFAAQARWVDCASAMTGARSLGEGLSGLAAMSSVALGCFKSGRTEEALAMLADIQDGDWRDRTRGAMASFLAERSEWSRALGNVGLVGDPFERIRLLAQLGVHFLEAGEVPSWSVQSVLSGLLREWARN
jgi:hypothetical protein